MKTILKSISLLGIALCLIHCSEESPATVLIKDATIMDGTGTASYTGSVRILDGFIVDIGNLEPNATDSIIHAQGMVLAPGFIDTHSHHNDDSLRTKEAAISQGITTIVLGQDGGSEFPLQQFFDSLEVKPWSLNVASYSGHNSLRDQVMGEDFRREATPQELDSMATLLKMDLMAGALGLSTGLEYDPGIYSNKAEVITLAKVAASHGGRYMSHMRSEDIRLKESIRELLSIGNTAKIPVQISHFKLGMKSLWGQAPEILQQLDSARAIGIEVTADIYPYEYWQSTMTVLFPERDFDNRETAEFALTQLTSPEGMIISRFDAQPEYENLTLDKIAVLRNEDPVTTYLTLIAMSQETPGESIIAKSMDEADIKSILQWPHSNLCSDGGSTGHPRGWGSFPRYLTMDTGQTMEMKIHKMTQQAAENLGMDHIGVVQKGHYADLVLFDPATIKDRATYEKNNLRSDGILWTMVSGKVVYENQKPTGVYSGRIIKNNRPTDTE